MLKKVWNFLWISALSSAITVFIMLHYFPHSGYSVGKKPLSPNEIPTEQLKEQTVHIEDLVTNLQDGRYVKISFSFVADRKDTAEEIKLREFQIKNQLIKELTSIPSKQLQTTEGMKIVCQHIQSYANQILQEGKIVDTYVTNKIIS